MKKSIFSKQRQTKCTWIWFNKKKKKLQKLITATYKRNWCLCVWQVKLIDRIYHEHFFGIRVWFYNVNTKVINRKSCVMLIKSYTITKPDINQSIVYLQYQTQRQKNTQKLNFNSTNTGSNWSIETERSEGSSRSSSKAASYFIQKYCYLAHATNFDETTFSFPYFLIVST